MRLEEIIVDLRYMSGAEALSDLVEVCGIDEVRTELNRIAERPKTLMGFPIHWTDSAMEREPFHITLGDMSEYIKWRPKTQGE